MKPRLLTGLVLALVVLVVCQQLALPALAERQIRRELQRNGEVESVRLAALPALKLLWRRADSATIRMRESTLGSAEAADLLVRTRGVRRLNVDVEILDLGPLRLREVRLRKAGDALHTEVSVSEADLRAALPPGFDVRPVAVGDGRLVFEGTAGALGRSVTVRAVLAASGGRLQLAPAVPLGGLLSVTVFSDPRVTVEDVGARASADGFTLTARARLTG